jgi:hypothetical protein
MEGLGEQVVNGGFLGSAELRDAAESYRTWAGLGWTGKL